MAPLVEEARVVPKPVGSQGQQAVVFLMLAVCCWRGVSPSVPLLLMAAVGIGAGTLHCPCCTTCAVSWLQMKCDGTTVFGQNIPQSK